MRKILLAILALVVSGGVGTSIAQASIQISSDKVSVCHVTGSETNPIVNIEVNWHSLDAHLGHGDTVASPTTGCDDGGGNPI